MSSERRRYEKLLKIINRVNRENQMGVTIVVEGMNDQLALKRIGFSGQILPIKSSGRRLSDSISAIDSRHVIVLTDFDHEGRELAQRIRNELERRGIHVNDVARKQLAALLKPEVSKIQEIPSLISRVESTLTQSVSPAGQSKHPANPQTL